MATKGTKYKKHFCDFCASLWLKIQAQADIETAIAGCSGDTPEAERIDVRVRIAEDRVIQDIHCIHPEFALFCLGDPESLDQVHIQSDGGRAFDPLQAKIADLSRRRIDQPQMSL